MQNQTTTTLTRVLSDILAELAFMFTDEGDINAPTGECWLKTTIGYEGSTDGLLRLTCPWSFADQLAANMLGLESTDRANEQESIDAIKEFMNVVCGQYITAAYGVEDVFHLTIPEVVETSTTPNLADSTDSSENKTRVSVNGQWLELSHHTRVVSK